MKARRKGTNEPFQKVASVCLCSGGYILIKDVEFEQEPNTPDHWQDLRERAAIAAVQGYMSCKCQLVGAINLSMAEGIADQAIMIADTLVKKLKGE